MISLPHNSLTFRLTLFIALASTLVFLGLGFLVGRSVEHHFEEQDIETLSGKMLLVKHALEKVRSTADLNAFRQQMTDSLVGHHGLSIEVLNGDGTVLFSTPRVDIPVRQMLANLNSPASARPLKWVADNGTPYRGIGATGRTSMSETGTALIAIATNISHHEHYMESFRTTLWSFMALAAFVMGISGWYAVRRGLLPLRSIRDEVASITARRLDARLPVDRVPAELGELAGTLNDMLGRLEASFRRLSDFSSDLAHELRTPVSNLLTETQVTLGKARTPEQYQDVLASNAEELERLSSMISDMLFLAKSDNALMIPHLEPVNLQALVHSLFDYYGVLAEDAGVQMRCDGEGVVRGDLLMLRRAISNLLSNAIRHTPAGGEILVRIVNDSSGEHRIDVENTGDPIPEEHLPRLFDRFYRVDASRQRSSEGAGLGLAITQSIMHAHGGSASARSITGRTTFSLRFPSQDAEFVYAA